MFSYLLQINYSSQIIRGIISSNLFFSTIDVMSFFGPIDNHNKKKDIMQKKKIQKIRVDFFKTTKQLHILMNNLFSYVLFYSFFFAGGEKKKRNQKEGE
jgi:hypothetical protein